MNDDIAGATYAVADPLSFTGEVLSLSSSIVFPGRCIGLSWHELFLFDTLAPLAAVLLLSFLYMELRTSRRGHRHAAAEFCASCGRLLLVAVHPRCCLVAFSAFNSESFDAGDAADGTVQCELGASGRCWRMLQAELTVALSAKPGLSGGE